MESKEFVIAQSFDERTLVKVSTKILLTGRMVIYIGILLFVMGVNGLMSLLDARYAGADAFSFVPLAVPLVVFAGIWYTTKRTILKNYKKSPRYYTNVTSTLTAHSFKIQGQDFENTSPWENYHKIKETKHWFLIYVNKYQAHIIDKAQIKDFSTEDLRAFFKLLPPKVKVSLKK